MTLTFTLTPLLEIGSKGRDTSCWVSKLSFKCPLENRYSDLLGRFALRIDLDKEGLALSQLIKKYIN